MMQDLREHGNLWDEKIQQARRMERAKRLAIFFAMSLVSVGSILIGIAWGVMISQ